MSDVFERAFAFSMREEGGALYTDDPRDPGGPTKYGVALNFNRDVIPDKNGDGRIDAADVRALTQDDALRIYRERYWRRNGCDRYPPAVAFVMGDMVFNPGPGAAPRLLQKALCDIGHEVVVDGRIGPKTLAAVGEADQRALVDALFERRLEYYRTRRNWKIYGRGWTARSRRCRDEARAIAAE